MSATTRQYSVEQCRAVLDGLSDAERSSLARRMRRDLPKLVPQPGPQTEGFYCQADVMLYGGAAGGGKTFLDIILAMTQHYRTLFIRKEAAQLVPVRDEIEQILGSSDGYNSQSGVWRIPGGEGRQIRFGGVNNPGDETKYQGAPRDLLILDEAANLTEEVARFLMGWVRSTRPGQRCRTVMSSNPPTDTTGLWLISYFAPWLSPTHPNPAKPGELRYFATIAGRDKEVDDGRRFVLGEDDEPIYDFDPREYTPEQIVTPQSRTFIPARVTDNAYLRNTPYLSTLQALPEPLRSQMLMGDFTVSLDDNAFQVIPTEWVQAAMARWKPRDQKGPMDSMGVDPARGGRDNTCISRRHGTWYDRQIRIPGGRTPDGPTVAGHVVANRRDAAPVHVDVIGIGSSVVDFLAANEVHTIALNGAEASEMTDRTGMLKMRNRRAALYWAFREALDPASDNAVAIPPDDRVLADLTTPRFKVTQAGILVESKEEIIKRIGRSPDDGDSIVYAWEATPKAFVGRGLNAPKPVAVSIA